MIDIDFTEYRYPDGTTRELKVEGHAYYDECGKDIVCAGVSAITQALAGYIENADLDFDMQQSPEGGYMYLCAFDINEAANAAFEMALIGLLQIEMAYPKHVTVGVKIMPEKI